MAGESDDITKVFSMLGVTERIPERRLFARLDAVSLAELVQLGARRPGRFILRLSSERERGYLYIEGGLIHAASFGEAKGLLAFARMLSLETGAIEACERSWPPVGNLSLEIGAALLRARALVGGPEPQTGRLRMPDRARVRMVDSIPTVAGGEHEADPSMAALCRACYQNCRALGDTLGLPRLGAARLTNDGWILVLFPDGTGRRLSAVLGARHATTEPRSDPHDAVRTPLPSSLGELRGIDGILGAFVAASGGEPIVGCMPASMSSVLLAAAAAANERLLSCTRGAGFMATGAELRFGERRLVIARSGAARVGIVAVSSLSVPWLRELARHLARCLGEPPRSRGSSGTESPAPTGFG